MARSFKFERSISSDDPITADQLRSGENILARLIAEAYAADHPDLFCRGETIDTERSSGRLDHPNSGLTARHQVRTVQTRRGHELLQTTDGP
jgi:hypothetical protein